jgi:D-glucosaminate-6-phosphate ammonia-lyase
MSQAANAYVDMHELFARAGQHIARLTDNEDAFVCGGASSGLFLAVLAAMTGGDQRAIDRLPAIDGLPNEFVIHRSHRVPPDPILFH